MTTITTFDSTKRSLQEILKEIDVGNMQLPDFQRGWIWDDDRIASLLASVALSWPIGALMTLETGGENVHFKPRPVAGTKEEISQKEPGILILDGQQRLTSMFRALMTDKPVDTKDPRGKTMKRWYYIDMKKALEPNGDMEEAVFGIGEDKRKVAFGGEILLDLTSKEFEYKNHCFPTNEVFNSSDWRQGYSLYWGYDAGQIQLFDGFERRVIKTFEQYQIPVIKLTKDTKKEAVCMVFEKVNTGGVALNVFELLTASFAAENFQLREDWDKRERRLKESHAVLQSLQSDDFLQSIALLMTLTKRRSAIQDGIPQEKAPGISCKRKDILQLTVNDYKNWADEVEEGFVKAARHLYNQKIFRANDLPYRTQLVPLSAMYTDLGREADTDGAKEKISRWYWCGVFGELYGGATETRFAKDLPEVVGYVRGGDEPTTIQDSNFVANRLLTLRTRNSAAYKGLYALLMREGCQDFISGDTIEAQTYFDDKIDIHHIFPQAWCQNDGIDANYYNSIINKTALSARTNRMVGGKAPSEYLLRVQKGGGISEERMNEILTTHKIEYSQMRGDDFWEFLVSRGLEIVSLIESVTQKPIQKDPQTFRSGIAVEDFDDGPVDWEDDEAFIHNNLNS